MEVGTASPSPRENCRGARGELLLGNNRYTRAVSKAYKLFRNPCAALKSYLHKSLECLTRFVNAPAPLGAAAGAAAARRAAGDWPQTGRTTLFGASSWPCRPREVPKLFFQSPCRLFINCLKLQEISGYQ